MAISNNLGRPTYVEPVSEYFSRKYFALLLAVSPLLFVAAIDVWRPEGWGLSLPVALFHVILIALSLALLLVYKNLLRFRRFRIFDKGFILPGSREGPAGARYVEFDRVKRVEAVAWPHRGSNRLLYIAMDILWPQTEGQDTRPSEITLDAEAIGRKSLIRLWQEWVKRGIASNESLKVVSGLR